MGNNTYEMICKYAAELAAMEHSGPVSIMVRSGKNTWMTRANADFENLKPEDIIAAEELIQAADPDSAAEEGGEGRAGDRRRRALAEVLLGEQENSELQAMVLAVTPSCSRIARRGTPLMAALDDMAQIIGWQVRQAEPDAASIRRALRNSAACFIGDAVLTTGRNLYEAVVALSVVEKSAEVTLRAESLGGVRLLRRAEAQLMRMIYKRKYSKAEQAVKVREGKDEEDGRDEA